ncbi:hypothetical protein Droror1_Dr00006779 [Drosera rotundifolia]
MCNKGIECLRDKSLLLSDIGIGSDCAGLAMENRFVSSPRSPVYNDENSRVKFLCSFLGSILPRPQDGKLRYVGGETRIVCVPRDIGFDDLMARMRELYESATILKYQQPDEDLDSLVSVVNDDDVMNMMEEYDKLGSGDGFTRLRIFLFSHPDQDLSPHFIEGDERDNERRYVDALNSLNESPNYRRLQYSGSPLVTPPAEAYVADQFNLMNLEDNPANQRNFDIAIPQYNLRHLAIPYMAAGQHSVPITQTYNEEASWNPAYLSPRYGGPNDSQAISELPYSPSSARHPISFVEVPNKGVVIRPEEYGRPQLYLQPLYEHQSQYCDNFVRSPPDKGLFLGNKFQGPGGFEGNSVCESCRLVLQRNHSVADVDRRHEEQSHVEHSSDGFPQSGNPSVEFQPSGEVVSLNNDFKLQQGGYNEPIDPRLHYGDSQTSEKGSGLQHQLNSRADEPRGYIPGAGRVRDHYRIGSSAVGFPVGHGIPGGQHQPLNYMHHNDPRLIPPGSELGTNLFLGQAVAAGSSIHIPFEDRGSQRANLPYLYGADNIYQQIPHVPAQVLWGNAPPPLHIPSPGDTPMLQQRQATNVPILPGSAVDDSPRFLAGMDQPWVESSQMKVGIDGTAVPDYLYGHAPNHQQGILSQQIDMVSLNRHPNQAQTPSTVSLPEPGRMLAVSPIVVNGNPVTSTVICDSTGPRVDTASSGLPRFNDMAHDGDTSTDWRQPERSDVQTVHEQTKNGTTGCMSDSVVDVATDANCMRLTEACKVSNDLFQDEHIAQVKNTDLSYLPELVASAKQAKLESVEVVKAICAATDPSAQNSYAGNVHGHPECESDNDNPSSSKIEPTKAEEEAFAKGLQTIRNDDLEEIRELGSGTYGSVYHGKWKGSDVAIKRIKSSCFTGRPSERERLIADFWKEALILSSLHHPNVVSFYGVVRDGPDGSLATVTEFMVNGSLKQYLRKKDRTIDRRKRLLLAMDAAFGMEYLHGKNIVHFDLKCENLLVNMRDPHRPVCKIGDLGLSKVKQQTLVSGGVRGTLPWMAPELLGGKSNMVTEKIDVYSFGIVMWELLTGDEPYADMYCAAVIGGIVNNTLRPEIPTWCDPEWRSLMESCWSSEPGERPSFSDISQRLRNMAAAMNLK